MNNEPSFHLRVEFFEPQPELVQVLLKEFGWRDFDGLHYHHPECGNDFKNKYGKHSPDWAVGWRENAASFCSRCWPKSAPARMAWGWSGNEDTQRWYIRLDVEGVSYKTTQFLEIAYKWKIWRGW